jgi:hypothetical protein
VSLFPLHFVHAKPPYMGHIDRPPFCSAKTDIDFGCPPRECRRNRVRVAL